MCDHRRASLSRFAWTAAIGVVLAFTGCSQEEHLEADPGVSPFYPGPSETKAVSSKTEKNTDQGSGTSAIASGKDSPAAGGPASPPRIDARFGTNEVERLLRVALRTAQKGDTAAAAEQLDKVLAIEPINREALSGRASVALKQANAATGVSDRAAAIDKAQGLVRSLMRAYDSLKPHEVEFIKRVFYAKAKVLVEQGQIDQAIASLKESNEMGFDPFARVENDSSMTSLRATPQYKAAVKADDDNRLAIARMRTNGLPIPKPEVPFKFTVSDLDGKKVSLSDFKGKVVVIDLWGTWCGPCREAIPGLIGLYKRWHGKGLEIVGLSYEKEASSEAEAQELVRKFVKEAGVPYPCLLGDSEILKQIPGWKGFPTTVIVDRAGKVRMMIVENSKETMGFITDVVRVLLAEPETKPGSGEPKRAGAEPKPGSAEPKPGSAEPKPANAEPKPASAEPKPANAESKPGSAEPKPPVGADPKPGSAAKKP